MATFAPFEAEPLIAVGVSGGPDSMALAWLAQRWAVAQGGAAAALLVDHRLRPESADEVQLAAAALQPLGVYCAILEIPGLPPRAGRPAWAREERYRLLEAEAKARGCLHLLIGHHLDDQAETLALNLSRGSGLRGLAAMRPERHCRDLRILRPLLGFPKARLVATAAIAGLPVADDPSNRDGAYARTMARRRLADGVATARLGDTAARLAADDGAIEHAAAGLAAMALSISPVGWIAVDRRRLLQAPTSVALRVLGRATDAVGGKAQPPRQARVKAALDGLRGLEEGHRTLAGAELDWRAGVVRLWREAGKRPPATFPVAGLQARRRRWDGRYLIDIPVNARDDDHIGALGYRGLRLVEAMCPPPAWAGASPRRALAMAPGLWRGDWLVAAPTFGALAEMPGHQADRSTNSALGAMFLPRRPIAPEMG